MKFTLQIRFVDFKVWLIIPLCCITVIAGELSSTPKAAPDNPLLQLGNITRQQYISPEGEAKFNRTLHKIIDYLEQNAVPGSPPSDIFLTTPELIHKHGYPSETHIITTEDGYILTYHRIPHGKNPNPYVRPIPVFLHHGIFSESTHFLTQPEFNCLPYKLADAGYDVWLGNSRGNRYSRGHVKYSTVNWQWHQIGLYDLSASIDYILGRTGFTKLNFIGHSMGTTAFYVLMSMRPEYNLKVNYMIALAPPVFMRHVETPVVFLAPIIGIGGFQDVAVRAGLGEWHAHYILTFLQGLYAPFCGPSIIGVGCAAIYFTILGFDYQLLNMTHLPVMMAAFPSSNPTAAMLHYFQEMNCRPPCFRQIDHGAVKNVLVYGSTIPPSYDLSKITVDKTVFYGKNDILVSWKDVEATIGLIPNTNYTVMEHPSWDHMDFLWAKNAYELLHPKILSILRARDFASIHYLPSHFFQLRSISS